MNKRIFSGPFLVFMLCGTIIPLGVIAFYGMTDRSGTFTLDNITAIATGEHWQALMLALGLALISTIICLVIAFPLGLILKDSRLGKKGFMVFIFILPMWMNFLLRTMAWQPWHWARVPTPSTSPVNGTRMRTSTRCSWNDI